MIDRKKRSAGLTVVLASAFLAGCFIQPQSSAAIATPSKSSSGGAVEHRFDDPDYMRALPGADIIIDAGHGGIDGGTSYGSLLEKDINLAVAKKLYLLLRASGIRAVLNRSGDYALSDENRWHGAGSRHKRDLSQRSQLSKEIETGLVVSLHVNWARDSGERGPLVLHQAEGQSALLAGCIQNALNQQQNTRTFPKIGKPYYLLNVVRHPAVIVEMGFISHDGDRRMLTNPRTQLQIASAIASGVRNYILLR